jgi:hypothetical protein
MRKNTKHQANCIENSYVFCRTKCEKRKAIPKCEFLKRKKKVKEEIKVTEEVKVAEPIAIAA